MKFIQLNNRPNIELKLFMLEIKDLRLEVVVTYISPTNVIRILIVDLILEVAFNYLQNWVMVVNKLNNYWQEKKILKLSNIKYIN